MGYRSEVAYVINFTSEERRNEYINVVLATRDEQLINALKECEVPLKGSTNTINFHAYDVKWYESFPDVHAHTRLYSLAEELYPQDCGWRFIRIGEEQGDIQEDTDGEDINTPIDDFYTYTSIQLPFNPAYEEFDLDTYLLSQPKEEV